MITRPHKTHSRIPLRLQPDIFTPGEQRIQRGTTDSGLPKYSYVLFVEVQSMCVKLYYSAVGQSPVPNSGPMDIPVNENCRINLKLDNRRLWEFRFDSTSDAMTLGSGVPAQYYPKLNHISASEIEFEAHLGPDSTTVSDVVHPFNLYVRLLQGTATTAWKVPIKIDPDILNPGDHNFMSRMATPGGTKLSKPRRARPTRRRSRG